MFSKRKEKEKKQKQLEHCFNCEYSFAAQSEGMPTNFCPSCGQENTDKNVSLWELIKDAVGNLFSLDSKLFSSIFGLILSPGKLSHAYNSGQRVRYVSPIRLYLFASLVYFTLFSTSAIDFLEPNIPSADELSVEFGDSGVSIQPNKTKEEIAADALINLAPKDDEALDSTFAQMEDELGFDSTRNSEMADVKRMIQLANKYPPDQALDSLKAENNIILERSSDFLVKQVLKLQHEGGVGMMRHFFSSLPIMMLVMLPLYAFILTILYLFSGRKYIEHLIFLFHLHALIYLLFSVVFLLVRNGDYIQTALLLMVPIILIYTLMALRRTYKQSYFMTFIKMLGIIITYPIMLLFGLVITLGTSFMFF